MKLPGGLLGGIAVLTLVLSYVVHRRALQRDDIGEMAAEHGLSIVLLGVAGVVALIGMVVLAA